MERSDTHPVQDDGDGFREMAQPIPPFIAQQAVRFCPTGKSLKFLSSPVCKNILIFRRPKSLYIRGCPVPQRGGSRSSGTRDRIRWTQGTLETRALPLRTAKSCGPDTPTLASSLRQHPQATVARKPGHRGERVISRKPLRGECRVIPV